MCLLEFKNKKHIFELLFVALSGPSLAANNHQHKILFIIINYENWLNWFFEGF